MHTVTAVVLPILVGMPAWAGKALDDLRPELQDWALAYGHALTFAQAVTPTEPTGWPVSRLAEAAGDGPLTLNVAAQWAVRRYPLLTAPGHVALLMAADLTKERLGGTWGWGGYGFALAAGEAINWTAAAAGSAEWRPWLAGLIMHEVGHGLGYMHDQETPNTVMWSWWRWPHVSYPLRPARRTDTLTITEWQVVTQHSERMLLERDGLCPGPEAGSGSGSGSGSVEGEGEGALP